MLRNKHDELKEKLEKLHERPGTSPMPLSEEDVYRLLQLPAEKVRGELERMIREHARRKIN